MSTSSGGHLPFPFQDTQPFAQVSTGVYIAVAVLVLLLVFGFLSMLMGWKRCIRTDQGTCLQNAKGEVVGRRSSWQLGILVLGFLFGAFLLFLLVRWGQNIRSYSEPPPDPCTITLSTEGCDAEAWCADKVNDARCYDYCDRISSNKDEWCLDVICPFQLDGAYTIDSYLAVDPRCVGWCVENFEEGKNCKQYACYHAWDNPEDEDAIQLCTDYCETQPLTNEVCLPYNCGGRSADAGNCACQSNIYSANCSIYCREVELDDNLTDPICDQWACAHDPRQICDTTCQSTENAFSACEASIYENDFVTIQRKNTLDTLVYSLDTDRMSYKKISDVRPTVDLVHWWFSYVENRNGKRYVTMASAKPDNSVLRYVVFNGTTGEFEFATSSKNASLFFLHNAGFEGLFEIGSVENILRNNNFQRFNTTVSFGDRIIPTLSYFDSRVDRTLWRLQSVSSFYSGTPFEFLSESGDIAVLPFAAEKHTAMLHPRNGTAIPSTRLVTEGMASLWFAQPVDGGVIISSHAYPGALIALVGDRVVLNYYHDWAETLHAETVWEIKLLFATVVLHHQQRYLQVTPQGLRVGDPTSIVYRNISVFADGVREPSYTLEDVVLDCNALDDLNATLLPSYPATRSRYVQAHVGIATGPFAWLVGQTSWRSMVPGECLATSAYLNSEDDLAVRFGPVYSHSQNLEGTDFQVDMYRIENLAGGKLGTNGGRLLQVTDVGELFVGAVDYLDGSMRFYSSDGSRAVVYATRGGFPLYYLADTNLTQASVFTFADVQSSRHLKRPARIYQK